MTAPASPRIRVLLVDDSTLVRQGIRVVLTGPGQEAGIEVVGEAATAAEAVVAARTLQPDVVLLDVRLPDGSGLDVCRQILLERPALRVLVLTSFTTDNLIYEAVIAGAQGYLMKEIDPAGLIEAVVNAAAGKSMLTPEITARVFRLIRSGPAHEQGADLSILSGRRAKPTRKSAIK